MWGISRPTPFSTLQEESQDDLIFGPLMCKDCLAATQEKLETETAEKLDECLDNEEKKDDDDSDTTVVPDRASESGVDCLRGEWF